MHPHLYELDQVNVGIQQNHRDAIKAEQLRMVRGDQPHGLATIALNLQSSIRTMVTSVSARVRHQPALSPEPAAEPVDATATT
jgi:hypothetical protein